LAQGQQIRQPETGTGQADAGQDLIRPIQRDVILLTVRKPDQHFFPRLLDDRKHLPAQRMCWVNHPHL